MSARIFIGSSTEGRGTAEQVAAGLSGQGFKPIRWWDTFAAGAYTLESLLDTCRKVDAAVFVLTADDRTWSRGTHSKAPRDNLVFELGLFMGMVGRQRTVVVSEPKVRLPTDIDGWTHLKFNKNDIEGARDQIVRHFRENVLFGQNYDDRAIKLSVDPRLASNMTSEKVPLHWGQRALYVGTEGAKAWLMVVNDPEYQDPSTRKSMREQILGLCKLTEDVGSLISLGPGDADIDGEAAVALRAVAARNQGEFYYIPVDISDGLLCHATREVGRRAPVPCGILCDFEDGIDFVGRQVADFTRGRRLVALLGNTFGNLDRFEQSLLDGLRTHVLRKDDYLLIDVTIVGPDWKAEQDPRSNVKNYSRNMKQFIANGIARRTQVAAAPIVEQFGERIGYEVGSCDVPKAVALNIIDKGSRHAVLSIRRYNWDHLLKWLGEKQAGFETVDHSHFFYKDKKNSIGIGAVLLKAR
jgi:predicted nucleotide-binding protein